MAQMVLQFIQRQQNMTHRNINKAEFFGEDFSGTPSEVFPGESHHSDKGYQSHPLSSIPMSARIFTPPECVGCWDSGGGVKVMMTKRPNWFHQKMTYAFFGWKWTDYIKENA